MVAWYRRFVKRLWTAASIWLEHDGITHAAAVAYYAALSVFPLLMLSNAVAHYLAEVFQLDTRIHDPLLEVIEQEASAQLREAVEETMLATHEFHYLGGPLSGAWLFLTALLVFVQLDRGFCSLWSDRNLRRTKPLVATGLDLVANRTRAVLFLFGFGLVFACIFAISHYLDILARPADDTLGSSRVLAWVFHIALHLLIHTLFFTAIFRVFTPMKVAMREALQSAFLLSVCWEFGRQIMAATIVQDYRSLYGISGAFLVILLWIYYASILIFFSAAYLRCLVDERRVRL